MEAERPDAACRDEGHLARVWRPEGDRRRFDRPLSRRSRRTSRPQRRRQILSDQSIVRRLPARRGHIYINGQEATINNPRDAKQYGIETVYQALALADNVDAASNLYLGRELLTRWGTLDDASMEAEARKVMGRLNPNFRRFKEPVTALSGGQRQSVAIARAIHFNARILIMDEPTAALGPAETAQVGELVKQLKSEGIGIFLISHDIHDVFDLADRVTVMKNGQIVGSGRVQDMTKDEVLGMIILAKCPPGAIPGPGAIMN